jgi:hypothetical protein
MPIRTSTSNIAWDSGNGICSERHLIGPKLSLSVTRENSTSWLVQCKGKSRRLYAFDSLNQKTLTPPKQRMICKHTAQNPPYGIYIILTQPESRIEITIHGSFQTPRASPANGKAAVESLVVLSSSILPQLGRHSFAFLQTDAPQSRVEATQKSPFPHRSLRWRADVRWRRAVGVWLADFGTVGKRTSCF